MTRDNPLPIITHLHPVALPQGRSQESIETFAEAIQARMMSLGMEHPDTVKLIRHVYDLTKKDVRCRTSICMVVV